MIPGDIEPIGHIPPRRRIENPPWPVRPDSLPLEAMHIHEKNRIWNAVIASAESSNIRDSNCETLLLPDQRASSSNDVDG